MSGKRELLFSVTKKDCKWDYYVGSGKGGQKRNRTSNCVRCTHEESGAVAKSEEGRSQIANKKSAFRKMVASAKFMAWQKLESARIIGHAKELEEQVERDMASKNLKVEVKGEDGKWIEES